MSKKNVTLLISMIVLLNISSSGKVFADTINGWQSSSDGWSYYENNNIKTGWLDDNGDFYYLKDNGIMATGWINIENNWYYMETEGQMKTDWQKINGCWYFFENSGEMKTGWLNDNGTWYYLDTNGAMILDTTIDGYYLGKDGAWDGKAVSNSYNSEDANFKDVIMKAEKDTYELGTKEINVYITNNGKNSVYYGLEYEVEKFENNKWIKVPFKEEQVFIEIAYNLEPGKTNSQVISLENLSNLTAGKYRIVKSAGALTAEFTLK